MKTIVVGYDGTEGAERALARAAELASALEGRLVVTSVGANLPGTMAFSPTAGMIGYPAIGTASPLLPAGDDARAQAEQHLERARAFLAGRSLEAELVAEVGDPVEAIVRVAASRDADLIVVGTREPGFLSRLLEGSVSQDVARAAHRDVLIVH